MQTIGQFRTQLRAAMRMELLEESRVARGLVAGAIASHETCTMDEDWDGPAAVADAPAEADVLRHMHAWSDPEGEADEKGTYKLPHHPPGDDTCANLAGVRNALARLSESDIPEDDMEEVEAHLQAHLDDAENEDEGEDGGDNSSTDVIRLAGDTETMAADDELPAGPLPIRGVLILEGVATGDGRFIEMEALSHRDLPLPLMANIDHGGDHFQSMLIGHFETLTRTGNGEWEFSGEIVDDPEARRVAGHIHSMGRLGISADLDELQVEWILVDEDGEPIEVGGEDDNELIPLLPIDLPEGVDEQMRVTKARIMGGTVTPFPAFAEAFIELALGEPSEETGNPAPAAEDTGEGEGEGAAVVAAAPRADAPREWFDDPGFSPDHDDPAFRPVYDEISRCSAVPLTVTDDGRVFGHLAAWGMCHTGYSECTPPVPSDSGYAYFRTGVVRCSDGSEVTVGQITMGTGHENDLYADHHRAAAHYDNTGTCVADIAVGEDEYGIWVAGAMREGVTDDQIRELRASGALSGDWRPIAGRLELVAALAVNSPGYPVARARVAAGQVEALIAAGASIVARAAARRSAPISRDEFDALMTRLESVERQMPVVAALGPVARAEARKRLIPQEA